MPRGVRSAANVQYEPAASPKSPASPISNPKTRNANPSSKPQGQMREVGPTPNPSNTSQSAESPGSGQIHSGTGQDPSKDGSPREKPQPPQPSAYWGGSSYPPFPFPPPHTHSLADALGGPMANPLAQLAAYQAAASLSPFMGHLASAAHGPHLFGGASNVGQTAGAAGIPPYDPRAFPGHLPLPNVPASVLAAMMGTRCPADPLKQSQSQAPTPNDGRYENTATDLGSQPNGTTPHTSANDKSSNSAAGEPAVKPEINAIQQQLLQLLQADIGLNQWRAYIVQQLLNLGYSTEQTRTLMALSWSSPSSFSLGSPFGGVNLMAPYNPFAFMNPPPPASLTSQWPYNSAGFTGETAARTSSPRQSVPQAGPHNSPGPPQAKSDPHQQVPVTQRPKQSTPEPVLPTNAPTNIQEAPKPHGGDRQGHYALMIDQADSVPGKEDVNSSDPSLKRVTLNRAGRGNSEGGPPIRQASAEEDERLYQHQLMMSRQLGFQDIRYLQVNPQPAKPSTQPPPSTKPAKDFAPEVPVSLQKESLVLMPPPMAKNRPVPPRDIARDSALYPTFSLNPSKFGRKNPANFISQHRPATPMARNSFQAFIHPRIDTSTAASTPVSATPADATPAASAPTAAAPAPEATESEIMAPPMNGGRPVPKDGFINIINPVAPKAASKPAEVETKVRRPRGRPREKPIEPPRQKRKYTKRGTKEPFKPEPVIEYGDDAPPSKRLRSQRKAAMDWPVFGRGPYNKRNTPMAVPPGAPPPVMPLNHAENVTRRKPGNQSDDERESNDSSSSDSDSSSSTSEVSSDSESSSEDIRPVRRRRRNL